jgi:yeast amino acid transporter
MSFCSILVQTRPLLCLAPGIDGAQSARSECQIWFQSEHDIREHVVGLPHFLNGFIFSAATTGINCLYGASRLTHAIASLRDAWPQWAWTESIRSRLEITRLGVPMNAVFDSWLFGFIAFSSSNAQSAETLGRIIATAATSTLIVYAVNRVAFLKFFQE